jgi:hypothetical protein
MPYHAIPFIKATETHKITRQGDVRSAMSCVTSARQFGQDQIV